MKRALLAALVVVCGLAVAQPAWAAQTTQVVQGRILRLVSVADWDAAGSLHPGEPVQWDVAVSADAPDPGIVTIGLSATGEAELLIDVSLCVQEWTAGGCPGAATVLRSGWSISRDGAETVLTRIADTETAYLRLSIELAAGEGSTDLRVHASGIGESAVIGPGGGLATTGMSPAVFWALGGGAVLLMAGTLLVLLRRRRTRDDSRPSGDPESRT